MFLNLSGNIFASQEANFVSATMFPGVGKQGNMDRKLNVSATMFPSLPRALNMFRKFEKITIRWIALFIFRTSDPRKKAIGLKTAKTFID